MMIRLALFLLILDFGCGAKKPAKPSAQVRREVNPADIRLVGPCYIEGETKLRCAAMQIQKYEVIRK